MSSFEVKYLCWITETETKAGIKSVYIDTLLNNCNQPPTILDENTKEQTPNIEQPQQTDDASSFVIEDTHISSSQTNDNSEITSTIEQQPIIDDEQSTEPITSDSHQVYIDICMYVEHNCIQSHSPLINVNVLHCND